MSSVQTTASTPRQNRILNVGLLVLGVVVLAAGIGVLAWKLTSGSSSTASRSAGNAAQTMLPAHQPKTLPKVPYSKLDPQIHTAVQTFLTTAVPRKDIAASWDVTAPALREGYTRKTWAKGDLPVAMFPVWHFNKNSGFKVEERTAREVHVLVDVGAKPSLNMRSVTFDVGLHKFGSGAGAKWKVDYFFAKYVPPVKDAHS